MPRHRLRDSSNSFAAPKAGASSSPMVRYPSTDPPFKRRPGHAAGPSSYFARPAIAFLRTMRHVLRLPTRLESAMQELVSDRQLLTILFADVSGYRRLMAAQECGTLANLKAYRE